MYVTIKEQKTAYGSIYVCMYVERQHREREIERERERERAKKRTRHIKS